ncbi:MAG: hypothetical protein HY297_05565 [Thaumarchaeota archaeon]|nr:hypothetical protein [Nitrososphaerota archaeon]
MIRRGTGRVVKDIQPSGDVTIAAELHAEAIVRTVLNGLSIPVRVYSENGGMLLDDQEARHAVVVDPIDGTYLALRGLPGSCIGMAVFETDCMTPIAGMVGDYLSRDLYWATSDGAYCNGRPIYPSQVKLLSDAYVSTCYGKRSRFEAMREGRGVVSGAFWTEMTGTMLGMVRVGSGDVDACYDLMLGYRTYDFAPGAYIASVAGAVVTDEFGKKLKYPANFSVRQKFVIAANAQLHGTRSVLPP